MMRMIADGNSERSVTRMLTQIYIFISRSLLLGQSFSSLGNFKLENNMIQLPTLLSRRVCQDI